MQKILVVDDERDIQQLLNSGFGKKNGEFEFVFTFSAPEAIQYLNRIQHEVGLFFDINMPGMSGFELLSEIKKNLKTPLPIVI
jgi:CheY-like chemotaxis protein